MESHYRRRWTYDQVLWASHCGNCIANCTYRLYMRDGKVLHEEQSGNLPSIGGIPDMNPLGCQKGASWVTQLDGGDRILHPMRRKGERGSGEWERIGWDEALDSIADAIIDAVHEQGTQSILVDCEAEGGQLNAIGRSRFMGAIDAAGPDGNAAVSDVHAGHWATFGNLLGGSTADDLFRSELVIIWHGNPSYTRIPYYHYIPESRYRGATVVTIAPDYSPSCIHADLHLPIRPGTDAALSLAMCKVLIDEGLINREFVATQTDMALLVKASDGRFLRESDLVEGGRDDRFHVGPRGRSEPAMVNPKLLGDPADPDLDARFEVRLVDGTTTEVATVFTQLRERLEAYTLETASEVTGIHADVIRQLAHLIASKRTKLYNGLGSCKHYHGDLMERSMDLALALSGNWGRPGTGHDTYIIAMTDGEIISMLKPDAGAQAAEGAAALMDAILDGMIDSGTAPTEGAAILEMMRQSASGLGDAPPAFLFYYHGGFGDIWRTEGYGDSPRPIDDHIDEAIELGWWRGLDRPGPDMAPRVFFECGSNILRRTRGGQRQLLAHLWPRLQMVAVADWKMSTVGLMADVFLPVACEAEKIGLHGQNSHSWERMFSDKAVEPAGEARSDWQIYVQLSKAIARRARERGHESFVDSHGKTRRWSAVPQHVTMNGMIEDDEAVIDEVMRDGALTGNLPAEASVSYLREHGWVRPERIPLALEAVCGAKLSDDEPFVAYRNHVEDLVPYETLTGRAQFYIDHPWFLEADEHLPRHKIPPAAGGDHPLQVTGGHPRWSIHATNTTSAVMLETTRGHPTVHLNPVDALARGIADDDLVRVYNDVGEYSVNARVSPAVRPGQAILYASWDPYVFPSWKDGTFVEPGMVKWLHFAGGYGHLGYSTAQWQPAQSDRLFRVEIERITGT